ncbi:MAG TPA: sulfatase-like hydrolase/transferase [Syntrophales bacterium]|nr:sulfatase-like hydrolase/transferase [Syntrophales bacterium]
MTKKITRREFICTTPKFIAAASLIGTIGTLPGCSSHDSVSVSHPNILLIMVDQMQTPPEGYGPDEGVVQGLKEIMGFRPLSPDNEYTRFFPGLLRLRQNAVVLRKHHTASSACVPSRASIMTGQYPAVHGVNETDGMFKTAQEVPWLDPEGIPTIGDWFRAVGYTTHYFGKWHVSEADESTGYLEAWGFSDWEKSYPEAHGGTAYNSGTFRDIGCADNVVAFLEQKGADRSGKPWLAVGSILNPHDCSVWPINWQTPNNTGVVGWQNYPPPPPNPRTGQESLEGTVCPGTDHEQTFRVALNPDGFPQDNCSLPRTYAESLDDKPRCQKDYALKWGLAFRAITDYSFINGGGPRLSPLPFQLRGDNAEAWSLSYNQFYFYCHYLADRQIYRMLQALDENGLTGNTIVIFLSDHGEMTGAHGGMIQKWHNAYEESIRVPMILSSPLLNGNKEEMREIHQPTSSIDFAPTVLALAGHEEETVRGLMETIHGKSNVRAFAGADLSSHVTGENTGDIVGPDGKPRAGVFFMTNDTITDIGPSRSKEGQYDLFQDDVDTVIAEGYALTRGSVRQPNRVRALCTGDWKIVHYVDPSGVESDEWELYCLTADPVEQTNLVDFRTGEIRDGVSVPGMTEDELIAKNDQLRAALAEKEAAVFG